MQPFTGIVERGAKRGTALGFPTANIALKDASASGIYAARVTAKGAAHFAAVYADQGRQLLEAHLLDFSGDLYGERITIELLEKIRDSVRFESDAALASAIAGDVAYVEEYRKMHQ